MSDTGITPEEAAAEILGTTPSEDAEAPESASESAAPETDDEEAASTELAEPEESEEESSDPEEAAQGRLQKLISQKGGVQKFVDGLFESWNGYSALSKDLKSVQSELEQLRSGKTAEPPPAEPEASPDMQWLRQQVAVQEGKIQQAKERQSGILTEAEQLRFEIAGLEGEARRADEYEKTLINEEIARKKGELRDHRNEYQNLLERIEQSDYRMRDFARQYGQAERELRTIHAQRELQRAESVTFQKETVKDFLSCIEKEAATLKIPVGSKARGHIEKTIRAQIIGHLTALPEGAPAIDIAEFVKQAASEYAEAMGYAKRETFGEFSKEKLAARPLARTVAEKALTGTATTKQKWTADDARKHAQKVLGG